jgi:hypothetical protein
VGFRFAGSSTFDPIARSAAESGLTITDRPLRFAA